MALCPGLPGWASTRRNVHPPSILIIIQYQLLPSTIYYDPQHPPCSNYVLGNLFAQPLSTSSLVYLLVWRPSPHIPYISSPNQCLLFATHTHTIATCFAIVPRLYNLFLTSNSVFYLIHLTILISARWSATSFSFLTGQVSEMKVRKKHQHSREPGKAEKWLLKWSRVWKLPTSNTSLNLAMLSYVKSTYPLPVSQHQQMGCLTTQHTKSEHLQRVWEGERRREGGRSRAHRVISL